MRLAEALRLAPGRIVAFTGAGGKTSAIRRLVGELAGEVPVVVTTTTRMAVAQSDLAHSHLVVERGGALGTLRERFAGTESLLVTGPEMAVEGKWSGLDGPTLDALIEGARLAGAVTLLEADGARQRSWKAPADHEPVIPPAADLVVPVVGLDVVGARLDSDRVHRPERVAEVLGLAEQDVIAPEHVAALLASSAGGLRGVPPHAEVRSLLNKVELPGNLESGREIAGRLLDRGRLRATVLGSVQAEPPVREVWGRIAGVVLAAGESSRLGAPKQLAVWRGRPLVWHAVRAALDGGLSPVLVVTGASGTGVRKALAREAVTFVENRDWQMGQSASVRVGLANVDIGVEAVVFLLADTPFVTGSLVQALVDRYRRTLAPLVVPRADGRRGNPVLFDCLTFPDLEAIEGDRGGRALFDRYEPSWVDWEPSILLDVDSQEDLQRLRDLE